MYGVLARNRGMWACESWCKDVDGNILLYNTKEEAQKVADKYNAISSITCFTEYFAMEYN